MGTTEAAKRPHGDENAAYPLAALHQAHAVVLLRWVLIVATAYLLLFCSSPTELRPIVALFIALYLTSNVVLTEVLPRLRSTVVLEWSLMVFDIGALTLALLLTHTQSNDLFVLYFAVLFLSALSERVGLVAGATVLIIIAHLYTVTRYVEFDALVNQGYLLRIPFLFVVGLFFGHLVHQARGRERGAEWQRTRALRLDLLAGVSHDLKNPLGVIESLADLLLEGSAGPLSEQQADLTNRIRSSTRQVIALSQNLIDADRIEGGRLVVQPRWVNLSDVIEGALIIARSASTIKGLTLHVTVDADLPRVPLDPVQMERLIANLLGNAIKFTPAGGRVCLHARRAQEHIAITVSDDGAGISADEVPRLMEPHLRGAYQPSAQGSGLGLFIVRAVAEAHGGAVHFASALGRGTTVTVRLPIAALRALIPDDVAAPLHCLTAAGTA